MATLISGSPALAQTIDTTRVAAGLAQPVYVTAPQGDFSRVFIVELRSGTTGRIRILNIPGNTLNTVPYLSIAPVATGGEQGLLGLAFHPNFMNNGYFFVNYTNSAGNTVIARYQANAPFATSVTANAATATTVLTITQPFNNHNGGWMAFAPGDTEGYMYISTGDGGSGNDPNGNGQNINVLLGKILRIDVDGPDNIPGNADDDAFPADANRLYSIPASNPFAGATPGADEIFFYGLRNPWRPSFDRANGRMFIADVGQDLIEEVDVAAAGESGLNFGWRCMEGNNCTGLSGCTCNAASLRDPILTYAHSGGACSITGGYVYRGCAIPSLQGQYFYADYCSGNIFSNGYTGNGTTPAGASTNRTAELAPGGGLSIATITSFGEDAYGEIYICDQAGEVFKIIRNPLVDCNANSIQDSCDIALDPALDTDSDGQIDACETSACCNNGACTQVTQAACLASGGVWQGLNRSCTEPGICPQPCPCDWNTDGSLTSQDFFDFLAGFFSDIGDFNNDGMTTSQDFFDFIACFFQPPMGC
ncbi:MAG: PQQ-dependent sugar dehydrogenase [Phycisphaerales bacterium]